MGLTAKWLPELSAFIGKSSGEKITVNFSYKTIRIGFYKKKYG